MAHTNVLVDNEFNIVGFIDFDGVMAAPSAVVAQLPVFMGMLHPAPGFVEIEEIRSEVPERNCSLASNIH